MFTNDKMQRKLRNKCISPLLCSLCRKGEESSNHLFLYCSFAIRGWDQPFKVFGIKICNLKDLGGCLLEVLRGDIVKAKLRFCGIVQSGL